MPAYQLNFSPRLGLPSVVVTADTPAQAIRFVAQALVTCTTLRGEEVASAVMQGQKIYDARDPQVEMNLDTPEKPSLPREMFIHKQGCSADPWTPIMGRGCKCVQLEMPKEDHHANNDAEK